MGVETRREPRKDITVQVRVRVNPAFSETVHLAKETIEGRLADISVIGIGLLSSVFLPPGVLIDIELPRLALADPNALGLGPGKPVVPAAKPAVPAAKAAVPAVKPAESFLSITGKVVYARPFGSQCRIGVSFIQIEEPDRDLIQAYVSRDRRC